jgi:hypothetical protein
MQQETGTISYKKELLHQNIATDVSCNKLYLPATLSDNIGFFDHGSRGWP